MTRTARRALTAGVLASAALAGPAAATAAPPQAAPAASAAGQEARALGLPVPDIGQLITDLGATLGTVAGTTVPGTGAIVTESSETVGGILTGSTATLTKAIDELVGEIFSGPLAQIIGPDAGGGGSAGGLIPADALEKLFGTLGIPIVARGPGTASGDGGVEVDASPPNVSFRVLTTKLRNTGRDGRLKLQVTSDEPGIVALSAAIRPGKPVARKRTSKGRKAPRHSRSLIRVPTVTLGFKKAGSLKITVRLSKTARRTLARSRDMRISARLVAADTAKNQAASSTKRKLTR